jgi:hypothetical protein
MRSSATITEPAPAALPKTSKQDQVLGLLRRPDGATLDDIMATTGWQAHSVRGFLSGTVRKKLGLTLVSDIKDGKRGYHIDGGAA